MDRRQIDRVELEVGLSVEPLVGALRVVDDVQGEVPVVPDAAVLAADLLARRVGIGTGPAADRLVVGEQRREPRQRAEAVDREWVAEVPVADVELVEKLVELADEVGRPVAVRVPPPSTRAGSARRRLRAGGGRAEDPLVFVKQTRLGDLLARVRTARATRRPSSTRYVLPRTTASG